MLVVSLLVERIQTQDDLSPPSLLPSPPSSIMFTLWFNFVDFMKRICDILSTGACSYQEAFDEGTARYRWGCCSMVSRYICGQGACWKNFFTVLLFFSPHCPHIGKCGINIIVCFFYVELWLMVDFEKLRTMFYLQSWFSLYPIVLCLTISLILFSFFTCWQTRMLC